MKKSREPMVKYLLRETRYIITELNELSDNTIEQWYREEIEVNRNDK